MTGHNRKRFKKKTSHGARGNLLEVLTPDEKVILALGAIDPAQVSTTLETQHAPIFVLT